MQVVFRTNVDHYQTNCWPTNIEIPPRMGEHVLVTQSFQKHYADQKLPIRMEVRNVTWSEGCVVCELWYCDHDVKMAKLNGVQLL